jgi:hypothetical protein
MDVHLFHSWIIQSNPNLLWIISQLWKKMILDCLSYQFVGQVELQSQIRSFLQCTITFEMFSTSVQDLIVFPDSITSSQIQDFLSILVVICTLSAFDGLLKASDSLFHVIFIQWKVGYLCKDSKFAWFLLHPNPRLLQGTWLMGPWYRTALHLLERVESWLCVTEQQKQ